MLVSYNVLNHEYLSQRKHSYQATISVYIQARSYIYPQNLCLAKQPKSYSINTGTDPTPLLLFLIFLSLLQLVCVNHGRLLYVLSVC